MSDFFEPSPGMLAFVSEWPSEGIQLTRQEIDAEIVREAAGRAEVLWEEDRAAPAMA